MSRVSHTSETASRARGIADHEPDDIAVFERAIMLALLRGTYEPAGEMKRERLLTHVAGNLPDQSAGEHKAGQALERLRREGVLMCVHDWVALTDAILRIEELGMIAV